jgi:hypothetical protein
LGDRRKQALRVQFDGELRLDFHGAKITSDAGLLAFREPDEAFRLTENGSTVLCDLRHGKNRRQTLLAKLRQGVYGRLAGYEDANDAERLPPRFRLAEIPEPATLSLLMLSRLTVLRQR